MCQRPNRYHDCVGPFDFFKSPVGSAILWSTTYLAPKRAAERTIDCEFAELHRLDFSETWDTATNMKNGSPTG